MGDIPRGAIPMLGPTSIYHVQTTLYMHLAKLTAIIVSYLFCSAVAILHASLLSSAGCSTVNLN